MAELWETAPGAGRSRQRVHSHRKAPRFMLDLFDALADSNGGSRYADMREGNVVRSFRDKGNTTTGQANAAFHYFHVKSLRNNEKVIRAELRWQNRRKQPSLLRTLSGHHFYKVELYEVLDSRVHPCRGNLISSRLLPTHAQGWEVFNVTQTVSKWVHNSDTNHGLLLVTSLPSGRWFEPVPPTQGGGDGDADADADVSAHLVVYSDDGKRASISDSSPHNVSVLDSDEIKSPLKSLDSSKKQERKRRSARKVPLTSCHRKSLYVDFQKIGWSSWIISPRGYNAYHCQGSCPFPLSESLRASNHATVQSIVHALRLSGGEVESPCCVPDSLSAISLLYFDDEENVVLKQYQDMVAASCGCH
ncbi:bone morphogenetic protein 2-B-like [Clupea harengus]|uniref:Bone morphogenetic protein 2-B-like n=1 Tax=Clupea harengus TaxID=7950 RepID=A0A8M1KPB9_CLUHA|nr:bone morphogenetic protein 2-B-like [Clupea harengus]